MPDCIFCKIANREIPKEFTYEDDDVMVFPDIHPIKPVHLLIIPKKHVTELAAVKDANLFKATLEVTQKMIKKFKLSRRGYRVGINGGGLQEVNHLHIHLMGPMLGNGK